MKGRHSFTIAAVVIITIVLGVWVFMGFGSGEGRVNPLSDSMKLGLDIEGGIIVTYEVVSDLTGNDLAALVAQTAGVLERRINSMGLTEPNIYSEGTNRIVIELPGVDNAEEAIALIGSTARLEFYGVGGGKRVMEGQRVDPSFMNLVLTGADVANATSYRNKNSGYASVGLEFNADGTSKFAEASKVAFENGRAQIAIVLDGVVISAPNVNSIINNGRAEITGNFTDEEARNLGMLIRGGALPAEMRQLDYSAIGPTLGMNALNSAILAAIIGIALVAAYMIFFYRLPGFVATMSLGIYILLILLVMITMGATMTLPGIAGVVLSIGMAVDANVIIFERIKENLNLNKTLKGSIKQGFDKAMHTIVDANVTTLIAAIVLYQFGSGPIKGFAVTLLIGIIVSMFTAIVVTRALLTAFSSFKSLQAKSLYGARG